MATVWRLGDKRGSGFRLGLVILIVALVAAFGIVQARRHPYPDRRGVPIPPGTTFGWLLTEKDDPDPGMAPGIDNTTWEMAAPLPSGESVRDFYLAQMPRRGWRVTDRRYDRESYRIGFSRRNGREGVLLVIIRKREPGGVRVRVSHGRPKPWWQTIGGRP